MPIKQSAKKALRQNKKNRQHNIWLKERYKKVRKEIQKLMTQNKTKEAKTLLSQFYKFVDKAAKKGVLKKNTAARKKSGAARMVGKM
ncbi:MAG: 30S ribosomal protein S20 [Parcubacteria group bacterium GW2011_GWA2_38_13b]|nr:MAG: 30S ribosomal protein S20 [Parcubacteria group bacterium GW2011_GWA2_38_13b]